MRRLALLCLLLGVPIAAAAQTTQISRAVPAVAVTLQSAATADGNGSNLPVAGYPTATLRITASVAMSGGTTINFEKSTDGSTWVAARCWSESASGGIGNTTTAVGDFTCSVANYNVLRARISAYSAGTITVVGYAQFSAYAITLFPVTGTVTANLGTLNGAATSAKQDTGNTSLASIDAKITAANTGAVVISSSALPTGAATSANQTNASQKTQIVDGSGNVIGAHANAADVSIRSQAAALTVDGSSVTQPVSGTVAVTQTTAASLNATVVGTGTFATQATLQTGSAQIGHLEANQSTNTAQINGVTPLMGNGPSGTGAQRVTIANDSTGILALTTSSAQIGHLEANQSVNLAQVAGATISQTNPVPTVFPGTLVSGVVTSAMTGTTSTSVVSGTASNYLYITRCTVSNASTTVSTDIILQDGSGGTTIDNIPAPAAAVATTGGGGATVTYPTPLKVPTAGNALYAQNVTTGSSTKIACSGFRSTVSY